MSDKPSGPKVEQSPKKESSDLNETLDSYIDSKTGLTVFTAKFLLDRGYCCNSNCRHCPYKKTP